MKKNETVIWVYADWKSMEEPQLIGMLVAQRVRGKEIFSFEYNEAWLSNSQATLYLDPNLGLYKGKQYLPDGRNNFGVFLDSAPDRWGRLLMRRREAWQAKLEGREERTLFESDFLLGVFDGHRMGGLRFKLEQDGAFLNNHKKMATPPWTSLRELEYASLQLEKEDAINDPEYTKWLSMLIDPGSSLGGARPKASVLDEKGNLWIAKFPSSKDDKNTGAWEMVLHKLAKVCGIHVPDARLLQFSGKHHTFLSKRFDRIKDKRIHFASAMTLLGYQDGADFHDGLSYLDIIAFIIQQGALVKADLEQLWRRVVFNILVSNTDDHLRNHGFILTNNGWQLSPAYDMNPNEMGSGLTLNISENSNEQDISIALETAKHYKLKKDEAIKILNDMQLEIANWRTVAKKLGISSSEIEQMKRAFRVLPLN
ncbi:MAG: HipA domain-containing protein [Chitinophagaceae bacterium]|nr:HipA domain-containing protein [Chitinophagaceae bacterium]